MTPTWFKRLENAAGKVTVRIKCAPEGSDSGGLGFRRVASIRAHVWGYLQEMRLLDG